jgi:imidazolonepropionase-like amidohydrolase
MSDELLESLVARQIVVCPTLGRAAGWSLPPDAAQSEQVRWARHFAQRTGITPEARQAQVGQMHQAGVRLVSGADAGIGAFKPHGVLPMAICDFVAGGIPTSEALASATSDAADVCGLAGRKGRLRPGHDADMVVVDGDLFTDMSSLRDVRALIVHGQQVN